MLEVALPLQNEHHDDDDQTAYDRNDDGRCWFIFFKKMKGIGALNT